MKLDFKWLGSKRQIAYERSGGDEGALRLANNCKRLMEPYVPARNLVLAQNVRTYVKDGTGVIHYESPYAHYQYEGILYVSSKTGSPWARHGEHKVPARPRRELKQSKARHPLATSHWDKAMWTARGDEVVRAYQRWLNRRPR